MTEIEAIEQLKAFFQYDLTDEEKTSIELAIKALKENQRYKAIGTIEEFEAYNLGDCMNDCKHYDNCSNYIYSKGYNQAIDDFYDKVLNFEDYIEPLDTSDNGSVLLYSGKDITNMIVKIKEEIKGEE